MVLEETQVSDLDLESRLQRQDVGKPFAAE